MYLFVRRLGRFMVCINDLHELCVFMHVSSNFMQYSGLIQLFVMIFSSVCDDNCREVVMDPTNELWVCTISGHCFDRLLSPAEMEPDSVSENLLYLAICSHNITIFQFATHSST